MTSERQTNMLMPICPCHRISDLIKILSFVDLASAHIVHSQPWSGVDLPAWLHCRD